MAKIKTDKAVISFLEAAGELMKGFDQGIEPTKAQKLSYRSRLEQVHNDGLIDDQVYDLVDSGFKEAGF